MPPDLGMKPNPQTISQEKRKLVTLGTELRGKRRPEKRIQTKPRRIGSEMYLCPTRQIGLGSTNSKS